MAVLPVPPPPPPLLSNTAGKPSLTRVTTHPVVELFLGAIPRSLRLHPDAYPTPNLTRFAALLPDDPRRPTNYKTGATYETVARHERLRTFTDVPRNGDRKRPSAEIGFTL